MRESVGLQNDSMLKGNQSYTEYRRRSSGGSHERIEDEDNDNSNSRSIFNDDKQLSSIWEENKKLSEELTSEIMDLTKLKWKKGKGISLQRSPLPSPKSNVEDKVTNGKMGKSKSLKKDSPDFYLHVPTLLLSKTISLSRTLLDQTLEQETYSGSENNENNNFHEFQDLKEEEHENGNDSDYKQTEGDATERGTGGFSTGDSKSRIPINSADTVDDDIDD